MEIEQISAKEQLRKEQQRPDRIPRLKANGLQDRALLVYTFRQNDGMNAAMGYSTHISEQKKKQQS